MNGFLRLFFYYFRWRSILTGVAVIGAFAALVFIVASLYSFAIYLILPSRYMPWWFTMLPLLTVAATARFNLHPTALLDHPVLLIAALLGTAMAWALLLYQLAHTRKFAPLYSSIATSYTQHHTLQHSFGPLLGALRGRTVAIASLLFAYPASAMVRYINVISFVLLQPMMAVLATQLLGAGKQPSWVTQHPVQIYLMFSLFMGSIATLNQGELGARARLLWLRLAGTRAALWQRLERELWLNLLMLAATLLAISLFAVWLDPTVPYLGHYTLLVMACNGYFLYFQLCSRLYQWSSLVQGLVLVATSLVVIAATVITLRTPGFSGLALLEPGLVLSATGFRLLARRRFIRVDWLQLRHVVSRQVLAEG